MNIKDKIIERKIKKNECFLFKEEWEAYEGFGNIIAIGKPEAFIIKRITNCYPFNEPCQLKDLTFNPIKDTYDFKECSIQSWIIHEIIQIVGSNITFYTPKKLNPIKITIKNSNYIILVAPFEKHAQDKIVSRVNSLFYTKKGFQALTGCTCPILINGKRDTING